MDWFFGLLKYRYRTLLEYRYTYRRLKRLYAEGVYIGTGKTIIDWSNLSLKPPIYIGEGAWLMNHGLISIGSNSIIGPRLKVLTQNHVLNDDWAPYGPELHKRPVRIGEGCWIGADVTLLPGTVLGNDTIVGAGSVVRGTFEAGAVIIGNPAKVVRERVVSDGEKSSYLDWKYDNN